MRPVLHDATEQRTTVVPIGISLRQVAHTSELTLCRYHEPPANMGIGFGKATHLCKHPYSSRPLAQLWRQELIECTAQAGFRNPTAPDLAHLAALVEQHQMRNGSDTKQLCDVAIIKQ